MLKIDDVPECVPSVSIYCERAAEIHLIGLFTHRTDARLAKLLGRLHGRDHIATVLLTIVCPGGDLAITRSLPRLLALSRDPQRRLIAHVQTAIGPACWIAATATSLAIDRTGCFGLGQPTGDKDSSRVPELFWDAIQGLRPLSNCRNIGERVLSSEECEARGLVDAICHKNIAKSLLLEQRSL